ncbi:MAG: MBL fold metallo-hydrolase [Methanomicrobiales archaeon]
MEITFLGTGDAVGTPKIGCTCPVCTEARRRGIQRLRTSLLVESDGTTVLIDTSPDLRGQLLATGSPTIDAVIWTHGHYDHFIGYGEFYRIQDLPPVYAAPRVLEYCVSFFHFLDIPLRPVTPGEPFRLGDLVIDLFPVHHPTAETCGIRLEENGSVVVYTADTRRDLPEESMERMEGADLLIADAIAPGSYHIHKHMNYAEAVDLSQKSGAADLRCVHMSHLIDWETPCAGHDGEVVRY